MKQTTRLPGRDVSTAAQLACTGLGRQRRGASSWRHMQDPRAVEGTQPVPPGHLCGLLKQSQDRLDGERKKKKKMFHSE